MTAAHVVVRLRSGAGGRAVALQDITDRLIGQPATQCWSFRVLPQSPCRTPQLCCADARRTPLPIAHVNRSRRVSNTNALCLRCEPFIMLRCLGGPLAPAGLGSGPIAL